jgi:hypothetical protein
MQGRVEGFYKNGNETSGPTKRWEVLVAAQLPASRIGPTSMELSYNRTKSPKNLKFTNDAKQIIAVITILDIIHCPVFYLKHDL